MRYQPILFTSIFFAIFATVILAAVRTGSDWPPGGATGFVLTVIVSVLPFALVATVLEYLRANRQAAIEELAEKLFFTFAANGSREVAEQLGKRLGGRVGEWVGFDGHEFELHCVLEGERKGVQILVGDLRETIEGSETNDIIKRTIFYFSVPYQHFPRFALEPKERRRRLARRLVGSLASRVGIDDPDSLLPLAGDYHLSSSEAEATKQLFDAKLQNYLATHKGWKIYAEHDSILFARNGTEPVAQWEVLLGESWQILSLLNRSA